MSSTTESDFFTYRPGNSSVHNLSPVTKLVCGGALVAAGFLAPNPIALPVLLNVALLSAVVAGVSRSVFKMAVPILVPLGIGLLVLHGLFTPMKRNPIATVGPLTVWQSGLVFGLRTLSILAVFVLVALVFVATTHPKRLTTALVERGVPENVSYVFLASLQLVLDLQRRARRIVDAQQSRGLAIDGGLADRFRAFVALADPLLIGRSSPYRLARSRSKPGAFRVTVHEPTSIALMNRPRTACSKPLPSPALSLPLAGVSSGNPCRRTISDSRPSPFATVPLERTLIRL